MSYDELDKYYTDGNTIVLGRELPKHLWREGLTDEQEDAFAQYVNDSFTPYEILEYCNPIGNELGCGRQEFFEDWVSDMVMYHDDDLEEVFGFREVME